jgi:hypothetical protein
LNLEVLSGEIAMSTGMVVAGNAKPNAVAMQEFVKSLGSDIAKSQMFGCESTSQGNILALACIVSGRDPLSLPMEFHLMKGKLTLRADAMLGRLSKAGGKYEVIEHSPDAAEVKMEFKGRKFHQRFTWEEAQQEPFVYEGKGIVKLLKEGKRDQLVLKDNYATPRRRMQQMWCRVISDGVRVVAPELVTGVYTGEETADYTGFDLPVEAASKVFEEKRADLKHGVTEDTEVEASAVADVVEDAEVEPVKLASAEQVKAIDAMFKVLGMGEAVVAASLAKRGVDELAKLPVDVAAEFLKALEERHAKVAASNPTEAGETSVDTKGPITQELLEQVVAKFKAAAQRDSKLVERVKEKLQASGLKLGDLTYLQGAVLKRALEGEEVEKFFEMPLVDRELKVEKIDSDGEPDSGPDV